MRDLAPEPKYLVKMPELLVFAKAFALGVVGAEVARLSFYAGQSLTTALYAIAATPILSAAFVSAMVCAVYVWRRGVPAVVARLVRSRRVDLFLAAGIGVYASGLMEPWLRSVHELFRASDPSATATVFAMLLLLLLSPVARDLLSGRRKEAAQLYFLADEEIKSRDQDIFSVEAQAKSFAEAVLASKAHAGLVFGVDGPWGIGKTSFINLAEHHWAGAGKDSVVVFRFEPLRYASEPNLAERFIEELSASIQKQVFVPEFRPAASRYSRMLKGRADISFLGFKLSMEPTSETLDELLEDIDDVLKRIGRRLVIVIDDLDRLETRAMNSVLFTVRRTFKLSRATYILCYDTEKLIEGTTDREQAREFLEKFITVKFSLFIDSAAIKRFLERDWSGDQASHLTVPPERMIELASILTELGSLLDGEQGASYMSLVGDMRKVKRFVNAALLMRIGQTNLSKTDFNTKDLINLMLLYLNYPGIFRRIYVEESDGRLGMFCVRRKAGGGHRFANSDAFADFVGRQAESARFLLRRLFDVREVGLDSIQLSDETQLRSRACFNEVQSRNLEAYLKLIVRLVAPIPQQTFVLYRDAVNRVRHGTSVASILESSDFKLSLVGEDPHDHFWRLLVNQSYQLARPVADDAIETLVRYLSKYSLANFGEGLRQGSIFSLALLVDRAGWGEASKQRTSSHSGEVLEIAYRIFGEKKYQGRGIIGTLASEERGALGWNDLMLFRLLCSADRGGQLHNLQSSLLLHQDAAASTSGELSRLALEGMRHLSQTVFALFKKTFIEPKLNFLAIVDDTSDDMFTGEAGSAAPGLLAGTTTSPTKDGIAATRASIKAFVVFQLSNRIPPTGSGVGCGLYDEAGSSDTGQIARVMNDYIFGVCFNPDLLDDNIYRFLDYCLANLSSGFFTDEDGYIATSASLPGGLDPVRMAEYWRTYRALILGRNPTAEDRQVATANYVASYRENLQSVIEILDGLTNSVGGS